MNKSQLLESLKQQGFSNQIIKVFSKVKRENFIPKEIKQDAYEDTALSIGEGQTISQPYTIATMLDLLDIKENSKVLEIGSGCGYVLAILSEIVGEKGKIYGIDIIGELVNKSINNTKGYENIKIFNRNGNNGLSEKAPFDRILISAGLERVPKAILNQLKNNGILVAPVGDRYSQTLTAIQRKKNTFKIIKKIQGFIFVRFV